MYNCEYIYIYTHIYIYIWSPLQIGGCWTPRFCRDPQGQVPKKSLLNQSLLSRVGSFIRQNQEPSTVENSDKADSYVLQNQEPHIWRHQKSSLFELKRPGWFCRCVFWSRFCRDLLLVFDFVVWMCYKFYKPHPKSQVPAFHFVATSPSQVPAFWFCHLFLICSLQNQTG